LTDRLSFLDSCSHAEKGSWTSFAGMTKRDKSDIVRQTLKPAGADDGAAVKYMPQPLRNVDFRLLQVSGEFAIRLFLN
jgi:hypothetical protein